MNDKLLLGLKVEVEDSEHSNTNDIAAPRKRKIKDDTISLPNLKNDKRKRILKGLKSGEVRTILKTDPFKFCQNMGLLSTNLKCNCNADMKLTSYPSTKDIFVWRCRKNGHSLSVSVRKGTFFENSRLSLYDILWVMYMWVYEYSLHSMMHECDHSYNTLMEWCTSCLHLCREILERKRDPLGGDQKTVNIFECNFPKKKSKKNGSEKWVFCALEYDSTNSLLITVEDKTSESILKIFDKYILPESKLVSHVWSAFKNLTADNFDYLANEKSIVFYNLWTNMKMDTFEEYEFVANQPTAGTNTWHKAMYEQSFFEKMYRKSLLCAPDAYIAFLKDVALVYKPLDVFVKLEPKTEATDDLKLSEEKPVI